MRVNPKYVIERQLGGGGMAEVFLARASGAEGFTRRVALKRILPRFSEDAEFARLFVSEAQLASRLQHPNLVSVVDFDRDEHGRFFLIMELVDGIDLDGLLDRGPLSVPVIIYLATEILSGLRYAHDLPRQAEDGMRGVVHRDISPHNILLSWEGAVKVSDFGIAKSRGGRHVTATAVIKGKPSYMSPEQANGHPLDGRSDLFSVGVMLWEMLCLRPLFSGATARETIGQMLCAPISSPRDERPDVPEDLSRVVLGLLVRDRAQRTPTADVAIAALVACADHPRDGRERLVQTLAERFVDRSAGHVPGAIAAADGPATLTAAPGVVLDPMAPSAFVRRYAHRQRRWLVLTSFAIVGSLAGGGLALCTRRSGSTPLAIGAGGAANGTGRSMESRTPQIDEVRAVPGHGQAPARLPGEHRGLLGPGHGLLGPGSQGEGSDVRRE